MFYFIITKIAVSLGYWISILIFLDSPATTFLLKRKLDQIGNPNLFLD